MAPGAPRGKRKPVRGGGKNFSRNLRPLDEDDFRDPKPEVASSDSDSDAESSSEDEGGPSSAAAPQTREERKAAVKAKKDAARARAAAAAKAASGSEDDDDDDDDDAAAAADVVAPRKPVKGAGGLATSNPNDPGNATGALSRREREAMEAAAAKERYWKLQEAGKTDQAKADLARLALIRQERDEKARQRKAEMEEKKAASELKASMKGGKRR